MKLVLEFETPIWTADATKDARNVEGTALLGSLRWWYEALVRGLGGWACDPAGDNERCALDAIEFGKRRKQGCKQLKIEAQNNNVPACRFYAARGCHLGAIDRYAYAHNPRLADETMLIWYLEL